MEQYKIGRINELARKHKSVGLTPEEEVERTALRREYIDSMVNRLKGHLDNTYFVEEDGSHTKLKKKGEK